MKIFLPFLLMALISLSFFSSCEKNVDEGNGKSLADLLKDKKSVSLIRSDNSFTLDLLKKVDSLNQEDNFMISPLSVAIALGMTYNGAENETQKAFEQTLRIGGMSRHDVNRIHGTLIRYLLEADPKVKLEIANSMWVHHLYHLQKTFSDTNVYYYNAKVTSLDFFSGNAEGIINDWVSGATHGKINSIIDQIPDQAVLYLINALYFNGNWTWRFDKDKTADMLFHYQDGSTGNVAAMQMTAGADYYSNDIFRAIELPYGNGKFAMTLIMPSEGLPVSDVITWLDQHPESDWLNHFEKVKELLIRLPKFKFEYKTLLNQALSEMGLAVAFTPEADFSGMLEEKTDLGISRVIHKTYIDVNEEGTEAAAATAVEVSLTSIQEPVSFIVDRSFLFFIREKETGTLLFAGKVQNPAYDQ